MHYNIGSIYILYYILYIYVIMEHIMINAPIIILKLKT